MESRGDSDVRGWRIGSGRRALRCGKVEAMAIDEAVYDEARLARDARFDGKFFIGITSTGISWSGSSTTVSRALRLIADGALDAENVVQLSDRLGVSARHLDRQFRQHLGASPAAVARARRVQFAKQLITDTRLSMSQVAAASGFQSVRRFNDSIRKLYGRTPTELRRLRLAPLWTRTTSTPSGSRTGPRTTGPRSSPSCRGAQSPE